jgi:ATP-dependent DNA helicase RecG
MVGRCLGVPLYRYSQRIETLEYPEIALREAILNAVIHRDYTGYSFFTIKIFDNSLEIWNEGKLMDPLNISSLKTDHLSRLRNKLIASIFYRSGQIESWGRGTLKMLDDARSGNYPEPEFEEFMEGIRVHFRKKIFTEAETTPDNRIAGIKHAEKILALIMENPKVTVMEMATYLKVPKRTVERTISKLVEIKIIERKGSKKLREWIITE